MNLLVLCVFAVLNTSSPGKGNDIVYPKGYFISPIDVPISLVGNFGEPRAGHFHTGLDMRTNQEEGHKVLAAADGYISRINVSGSGYGNALYVTHPNGYTTVYGHLQRFSTRIQERLRKEQYAKESFAVDFNLSPGEIRVKQGEVIALSGSTGSAAGPHLHFEIRDSTEHPINPLLFGFQLADDAKPVMGMVKFYPMDDLKYKSDGCRIAVTLHDGNYEVPNGVIKLNASKVGISLNAYDQITTTGSRVGIYDMKMYDSKTPVYEYRMNRFSFTDKRYVLSHIDYPVFTEAGHKPYHKCFVDPGNKCPVYDDLVDRGVIDLSDGKPHHIKIEVSDFAGNTSILTFQLQQDKASTLFKENELKYTKIFEYDRPNEFSNSDIKLNIPTGCLFDNVYFNYSSSAPATPGIYSKVYQLDKNATQVFEGFTLSIKTEKLPASYATKAVLVHQDLPGGNDSYGGKYENGFITAKVREFGTYFVKIDTTPPRITALNIKPGRNMRAIGKIRFKIADNLSGIADFDTYLDDKWVVTDFDAKSSTLTHTLASNLAAGNHTFKVLVTDERKNKAEYSVKFKM